MSSAKAHRTEQKTGVERRAQVRHACRRRCVVCPEGGGPARWPGMTLNLSAGGVALVLPCPFFPGTHLRIEPQGRSGARPLRARIVRCNLVDFVWVHGCTLADPLDEAALRAWLR